MLAVVNYGVSEGGGKAVVGWSESIKVACRRLVLDSQTMMRPLAIDY